MDNPLSPDAFKKGMLMAYKETFTEAFGMYLDKGASLFETLDTITAEEASHAPSSNCATLAAHVEHVRFSLEIVEKHMLGTLTEKVDWEEIWRTVSVVTDEEWADSKSRLRENYEQLLKSIDDFDFQKEQHISGNMAVLLHTAYHLGEIRQMLCAIRAS